jgi:hypothetical protein
MCRRIITQLTGICTFLTLPPNFVIFHMEISHKRATRFLQNVISESYRVHDLWNCENVYWMSYFYSQKSLLSFGSINYSEFHFVKKTHFKRTCGFVISSQNFLLIFSYGGCK